MKKQVSTAVCLTFICLAGCTLENADSEEQASKKSNQPVSTEKLSNDKSEEDTKKDNPPATENPSASDEDGANNVPNSQESIIASVKEQIQNSLPPKLPKYLPMSSEEMKLSAATDSKDDRYRVTFFESKKAIPINDKELNDNEIAKPIAVIEARQYETNQEAKSKIGYISPEDIPTGNPAINLGHSIKGYEEGGMGNKWLNWHEGRWYLQIHANNLEGANEYVPLAKQMVDYLESNSLPVPNQYGSVKADVDQQKTEDNQISWQEEKIVYTISEVEDPIKMLEIATHFDGMGK